MYIIAKWFELAAELETANQAATACKACIQSLSNNDAAIVPLESLAGSLENGVVLTRNMLEVMRGSANGRVPHFDALAATVARPLDIAGYAELIENDWLHIQLNTLLPHDRFKTPKYLMDTIQKLTEDLRSRTGHLPFYQNALLVVDEHCDIDSRTVYDNDNKQWRCIPNTLKGKIFADDDQFNLNVALLTTEDETPSCHIYVLDVTDAASFFSMRAGGVV